MPDLPPAASAQLQAAHAIEVAIARHLAAAGRITAEQLAACLAEHQRLGGPARVRLAQVLVGRGLVGADELRALWARARSAAAGPPAPAASPAPPSPAPEDAPTAALSAPAEKARSGSRRLPGASGSQRVLPDEVRRVLDAGAPDRRLGRYVLLDELGRGGMGAVFRAYDTKLHRRVAIKTILEATDAASRLERFEREALAGAKLEHPGIVAVHEVGEHDGRPFIVMELVDGCDLEAHLEKTALLPTELAEIVRGVALALHHAHEHGIVHRDVKPENILIDAEGRPHLTDLGLAHEAGRAERLTATGQLVGTPAYMAPEQAGRGGGEIGPRTDVYSLGAVLYRALTGRPPFTGEAMVEVVRRVLFEDPEPPRRIDSAIHGDLETIALRCLAKEPERRYPSAQELAEDLRRFIDGELIHARPAGRAERVRRWVRRNRALATALAASAAIVVVAAAVGARELSARRRAAAERERALRDARLAAVEQERARRIRDAAADAERTRTAFEAARTGGDVEPDARLARGLEALQAARLLSSLQPDDDAARRAAFDAAMALGEVAGAAGQWSAASSAFAKAAATGVDDARANEALAAAKAAGRRVADERRARVAALLEAAREDRLARRPGAYEDALFELVTYQDAETTATLIAALDEVCFRMGEVTRDLFAAVAHPTQDEERAGARPIEGLRDALDYLLAPEPEKPPSPETARALELATERLVARRRVQPREIQGGSTTGDTESTITVVPLNVRMNPKGGGGLELDSAVPTLTIHDIVASAQAAEIGRGPLVMARLCCEALGRFGAQPRVVEAIARYLHLERSQERAVSAAVALALLHDERGDRAIAAARSRFGDDGYFWPRVAAFIAATGRPEPRAAPSPASEDPKRKKKKSKKKRPRDDE